MFLNISLIHKLASVKNPSLAMNHMAMLSLGHVITRVIENAKLRELVAKGPIYREPNRVNWKATETMFLESIDLCPKKLVQKRTSGTHTPL